MNVNGAMNAEDPTEVYTDMTDRINAQSTIRLLEEIIANNTEKENIYIISDNARYYYCHVLKEWLRKHPKIKWMWLPSYSPNLNLIERMWRFMQQQILNGYYYDTYDKFKLAIILFFENIKDYKDDLKTLMTLKFQIIHSN